MSKAENIETERIELDQYDVNGYGDTQEDLVTFLDYVKKVEPKADDACLCFDGLDYKQISNLVHHLSKTYRNVYLLRGKEQHGKCVHAATIH